MSSREESFWYGVVVQPGCAHLGNLENITVIQFNGFPGSWICSSKSFSRRENACFVLIDEKSASLARTEMRGSFAFSSGTSVFGRGTVKQVALGA